MTTFLRYFRHQCMHKKKTVCIALLLTVLGIILFCYNEDNGRPPKDVRLYVVEEHHEVLPYWYHETVLQNLNRSGNTIIHIDGHSDLAPPIMYPGFPFFRWPKGEGEVLNMMQRNDMFIQAAIIIGLVDHMIWIVPSWDTTEDNEYEVYDFSVGYALKGPNKTKQFCECMSKPNKYAKGSEERKCQIMVLDGKDAGNEKELDPDLCHIKKSIVIEKAVDNIAMKFLEKEAWAKTPHSIILDIDEDYFGCESGFDDLAEAGLKVETTTALNQKLSNMICAMHPYDEELANRFLKDYIAKLIEVCELKDPLQKCKKDDENLRTTLDKHILDTFDEQHTVYCTDTGTEALMLMADILKIFQGLSLRGLQALLKTGFCLNTSPKTLGFQDGGDEFLSCHGYNIPNETIVFLHTPKVPEIKDRMRELYTMLDYVKKLDLRLITLCRSVRDGYTPRKYANLIEDGILEYFRRKPSKEEAFKFDIIFDSNLLGGEKGWNGRYSTR